MSFVLIALGFLKRIYQSPMVKPVAIVVALALASLCGLLYVQRGYYSHELNKARKDVGKLIVDNSLCEANTSSLQGALDSQNTALELAKEKARGVVAEKEKKAIESLSEPLPVYKSKGADALNEWLKK